MGNIVSKLDAAKINQSINYLEHPVISSYFFSKEIKAYYLSIKHVDDRRDFHPTLIAAFGEFLSLIAEEGGVEVLSSCILSKGKTMALQTKRQSPITFETINPDGCIILELKTPLTFETLKSAYKKAVMKHHPDRGGSHETMLIINRAYQEYQEYLCANLECENGKSSQEFIEVHIEPENINDYIYSLSSILLAVHCDEWDIVNAYQIVERLQEQQYYGSRLVKTVEEKYKLVEVALTLTKRLAAANRQLEADGAMRFTRYIYKIGNFDSNLYFKSCIEEAENIVSGIKKLKVIVRHPRQASHALSMGVISKKQYDKLLQKFSEKFNAEKGREKILKDFLNTSKFIDGLPYDKGANKVNPKSKNVPSPDYFEDNRLHELSKDQQAEYFIAFSGNSSLDLVKKYTYVRLVSYLLSISAESENQFVEEICNECSLLFNIHNDSQRKNINTKKLVEQFGLDMKYIRDIVGLNRKQKIDSLKQKYIYYLTAGKLSGKKKCPFV